MGFNIRTCTDINECEEINNKPFEIKRCTDENLYPVNTEIIELEPEPVIEPISEEVEIQETEQQPNIFIGLGIVVAFVILGAIIGKKISN